MAFGTVRFCRLAKSFFSIMTGAAIFLLAMVSLSHLKFAFFHLEYFRVAVCAFGFELVDMALMAKNDRSITSGCFIFYIPSAYFLLRPHRTKKGNKKDHDAEQQNFFCFTLQFLLLPLYAVVFEFL
jgi:hypothetical protein